MTMEMNLQGWDDMVKLFGHAKDKLPEIMATRMQAMSGDFQAAVVDPIRDVTLAVHFGTGRLGDSTAAVDQIEEGSFLHFNVSQDAVSEPNMDGSGGGFHYAQMVLPPEWTDGPMRRMIVAPSDGPFSTGKRAFAGPDFGPVHSFMQYAGDPYPLLADPEIKNATELLMSRYSDDVLKETFKL